MTCNCDAFLGPFVSSCCTLASVSSDRLQHDTGHLQCILQRSFHIVVSPQVKSYAFSLPSHIMKYNDFSSVLLRYKKLGQCHFTVNITLWLSTSCSTHLPTLIFILEHIQRTSSPSPTSPTSLLHLHFRKHSHFILFPLPLSHNH